MDPSLDRLPLLRGVLRTEARGPRGSERGKMDGCATGEEPYCGCTTMRPGTDACKRTPNIDSNRLKLYGSTVLKEKRETFPELRS
jgi:hypothetical protein